MDDNTHLDDLGHKRTDRIFVPRGDFVLISDGAGGSGTLTATFRVPTPSARVRTKIAVFWEPVPQQAGLAIPVDLTLAAAKIWMGGEEKSLGRFTAPLPITNVIINPSTGAPVTRGSPIAFPFDSKLMGYGQEFETAADSILGEVTATHLVAFQGRWILQTKYEATVPITDQEWLQIVADCKPVVLTPQSTGTIA